MKDRICPNCKEIMYLDTSVVLTSLPPQYKTQCPKCLYTEYILCSDVIGEPVKIETATIYCEKCKEKDHKIAVLEKALEMCAYRLSCPYEYDNISCKYKGEKWELAKCLKCAVDYFKQEAEKELKNE